MKLSLGQLLLFWGVTAAMMLAAFYFGYVAGRHSGSEVVLEQLADRTRPLKIYSPRSTYAKTVDLGGVEAGIDSGIESTLGQPSDDATDEEGSNTGEAGSEGIDFTTKKSLPKKEEPSDDAITLQDLKKKAGVETDASKKSEPKLIEVYPGRDRFAPPPAVVKDVPVAKVETPVEEKPKEVEVANLKPKKGWYVQVAAVPSEKEAQAMYKKLSGSNLEVSFEPAVIRNRSLYRVLVGPFSDRNAALEKRSKAKSSAGVPNEPFIREVR